jgi:glycosyltransferase involved in cell wall biosynthesis
MKILLATGIYPPEIGGPATYAQLLAQELPKRGIDVDVLPFRIVRGYPKIFRHFVYFLEVLFRLPQVDLIFTQDPVSTGLPVVCAAALMRKKVVMRVAGDYAWEQARQRYGVTDSIDEFQTKQYSGMTEIIRSVQKFSVRRANVVITPSNYFSKLVSGWLNDQKPVRTIYNGIDLAFEYDKKDKSEQKTIITSGRLVPWKGFDTLIRSLPNMPEWRLLIAGDGPDKNRLIDLATELGVHDRVKLLGQLGRSELFTQISQSHIFALLTTFESFSFQTVEAMHIGTPVIASNIGILGEIVENGASGILIEPTDIAGFKSQVEKIMSDQGFRQSLVEKGKSRAALFSIDRTLDQLTEVFKELTGEKS